MTAEAAELERWLRENRITEVECLVSDLAGIARGKILPRARFLGTFAEDSLRIPESIFIQTVTGNYVESEVLTVTEPDIRLRPDPGTIRIVPWYSEATAQVICDAFYRDGAPVHVAPRQVLRNILALYAERGWRPVVAPELEFYLAERNLDPDYPLVPPKGRSGRAETGRQSYGIDAVNEYDPLFEDIYAFCEAQAVDIDTLIHESGAAQVEINFNHGDPLEMADQAFLFKRTVRQAALRHEIYATFMAKPYEREPGSAMHIHQSLVDPETGRNLFVDAEGSNTSLFLSYIAGLQRYMTAAMPLFAPYVNSYRRLVPYYAAPVNTYWGYDNRTVGLRVPDARPEARRIENRVPGADANPYLAIAATLACGWLGMTQHLEPTDPFEGNAYERRFALPRYLPDAMNKLKASGEFKEMLGADFVAVLLEVKQAEHDAYQQVISAWEREHLLLNV